MQGKRKVYRKRRVRKRTYKPKNTNKNLARRIKKIEKNIELKWLDELNRNSGTIIGLTPYLFTLNNMAEGDTVVTRTGQQISMTSLHLRMRLSCYTANLAPVCMRVVFVMDKHPNGLAPFNGLPLASSSDNNALFDDTVVNGSVFVQGYPYYRPNMGSRYKILFDRVFVLQTNSINTAATSTVGGEIFLHKKIKLSYIAQYDDATNNPLSLLKNAICGFVQCDQANGGYFECSSRVYFKDA